MTQDALESAITRHLLQHAASNQWCTIGEVAKAIDVPPGMVGDALLRLETARLVERSPNGLGWRLSV